MCIERIFKVPVMDATQTVLTLLDSMLNFNTKAGPGSILSKIKYIYHTNISFRKFDFLIGS